MERYLAITVDVEADWFDQERNGLRSLEGLKYLADVCVRYGMYPTYLLTYEMAERDEAITVISEQYKAGLCEIGHHLHVWSAPPFESLNPYGVDERWIRGLQCELPDEILREKMSSLHNAIESNYGVRPTAHRAGRWGIDERSFDWLEEHDYLVDTSVCPFISRKTKGISGRIERDTYHAPNSPYYPKRGDYTKSAINPVERRRVLEVPVTGYAGNPINRLRGINRVKPILNRLGYCIVPNISFRPSVEMPLGVYRRVVGEIFGSGLDFYNFMFHSSELTLGTSPYSRDEGLLKGLKTRLDLTLKAASDMGIKGIKLSDAAGLNYE